MRSTISINTLCLEPAGFDVHVDQIARLGATAISPTLEEILDFGPSNARRLLRDAGLVVATFTHRAFAYATEDLATAGQARLDATIAVAGDIGASSITLTTGGREHLSWIAAADRFAAMIAPCAERGRAAGVRLAIEPTSHLYADVSIAHRLMDTVTLARKGGINLGIDLFACWFDADIEAAIIQAAPLCAVVQVSDFVSGDRALPCRAVPGDGVVPLDRLLPAIAAAGFDGYWDLEIIGPRITAEGPARALARAAARIEAILAA
jgi:sugar phosphate isomerase/epimerase